MSKAVEVLQNELKRAEEHLKGARQRLADSEREAENARSNFELQLEFVNDHKERVEGYERLVARLRDLIDSF